MMTHHNIAVKSYSSKVILFGEYSVIQEGEILAAPHSLHTAEWKLEKPVIQRQIGLNKIINYLRSTENNVIDFEKLEIAIKQGVYLHSTIPSGYGLGSSGAITAGLYDLFAIDGQKKSDISELKQDLIEIESCFHGVSSGIDPLVIYLNKCLHIDSEGIHLIEDTLDLSQYFLIDTGKSRKTAPFVEMYLNRAKDDFYLGEVDKYKTLISKAIQSQLSTDLGSLSNNIASISEWQYRNLDFAILDDFRELWRSSLDTEDLSIKLCGAGGGGYLLGYALDVDRAISQLSNYTVLKLG